MVLPGGPKGTVIGQDHHSVLFPSAVGVLQTHINWECPAGRWAMLHLQHPRESLESRLAMIPMYRARNLP